MVSGKMAWLLGVLSAGRSPSSDDTEHTRRVFKSTMKSPFDYSGPSEILKNDVSFKATVTKARKPGGSGTIYGLSNKADEMIAKMKKAAKRDNFGSPFCVHILSQSERDRTRSIK